MTMKMAGVIYRAFKEGKLVNTCKDDIDNMYYFVKMLANDIRAYELRCYHSDTYESVVGLKAAVEAIFSGDYEKADSITKNFATVSIY